MKSRKRIYQIGIALTLVAFSWLLYNFLAVSIIKPLTDNFLPLDSVYYYGVFVWVGLLYFFFYHISSITILLVQIRRYKEDYVFRLITIILGAISLMLLLGDAGSLSDIGKESQMGWETNLECTIFHSLHIIHGTYMIMVLFMTIKAYKKLLDEKKDGEIGHDEIVFTVAQFLGILCGFMGLFSVFINLALHRSVEFIKAVVLWNLLFILAPYGILVLFWIIIKLTERPFQWYDEKQWHDVGRATVTTLLISLPIVMTLYLANFTDMSISLALVSLPAMLYLSLLVFSVSILYYNKFQ